MDDEDDLPVLGCVVDAGRGSLPYALIHGESLVACAAWALGEAGVAAVDLDSAWEQVRESGLSLVLHDALCPMTPSAFIAECLDLAQAQDCVVVAVRPVTDTVKEIADARVGDTVDRESLHAVTSPVVLPPSALSSLSGRLEGDFPALVAALSAAGFEVRTVTAPPQGRRVTSAEELRLLEVLTAPN